MQTKKNQFQELLNRQKLARNENFSLYNNNYNNYCYISNQEQKLAQTLEDMCILGENSKNEIIQDKLNNPGKYISTEEAVNNEEYKILGILSNLLKENGIETAIERNQNIDEEESSVSLQFLCNGLMYQTKYEFHFELGEQRNYELLYNKQEQEIFNNLLKKKLSIDYNIPEQNIIITCPQKGCYAVQVIFMSKHFDLNFEQFLNSCYEPDYSELCKLKAIQEKLIMDGIKLTPNMLDYRGNQTENNYGSGTRGGLVYNPPFGWTGYGLKVWDKYDNGNNDWLGMNGNKNEWAVAYHGIGWRGNVEKITNLIFIGQQFKPGPGQGLENDDDINHPGQKVGTGVFCTPSISYAEGYAGSSTTIVNGRKYKIAFMLRVNPKRIRCCKRLPQEWVLDGTTNEMRPYRLLLKETY